MTDRLKGCWVVFEKEYREDDAEEILAAIRMVKGVGSVEPKLADPDHYMARSQAKHDIRKAIFDLWNELDDSGFARVDRR